MSAAVLLLSAAPVCARRPNRPTRCSAWAVASLGGRDEMAESGACTGRRRLLGASLLLTGLGALNAPADAAQGVDVATFLPPAPGGLYQYVAGPSSTPGIRAGIVTPYRLNIPGGFAQDTVLNIKSGNFCLPNCNGPWTEVAFSSEAAGKIQVIAVPLINLTNKKGVAIEAIGPPRGFLSSVGPYIGDDRDSFDEESVVTAAAAPAGRGNQTYYTYEIDNQYARYAPHSVAALTIKGDVAFLVFASATEKQWRGGEAVLRAAVDSFQV